MTKATRARAAVALIAAGGVALFVSLFLTWSATGLNGHVLVAFGALDRLPKRTGWETYSLADVLMAVLAAMLVLAAIVRNRAVRVVVAILALGGLAFAIHALVDPPTLARVNRVRPGFVLLFGSAAGAGEIVAIAGIGVALTGLVVALLIDQSGARPRRVAEG